MCVFSDVLSENLLKIFTFFCYERWELKFDICRMAPIWDGYSNLDFIYIFTNWWNFTCSFMQQPHPQNFVNRQAVYGSSAIFSIEINISYEISKLRWMFSIPSHVFPFISINFIEKSARHSSRGMMQFYSSYAKNPKTNLLALTEGVLRVDQEWRGSRSCVKPWMKLSCLCGHR